MVRTPSGTYNIGCPEQPPLANRAAMPQHSVTIKPFRIDRAEVTNARFACGRIDQRSRTVRRPVVI